MNYNLIKTILFNFQPETAHNITEFFLKNSPDFVLNSLKRDYFIEDESLKQSILGIDFLNPVGIGAGFDKNATMVKAINAMGFGFAEVGTITPKSQEGNPKPRMFRYPEYKSVQNAMGFNNAGAELIYENIKKLIPYSYPLGINIGKNKLTSEENAIKDYEYLIDKFEALSDYLVINISSPNTPNLRDLQNEAFLKELFSLAKERTKKPIFLKIAPDMSEADAINISTFATDAGASGIIATNTTTNYSLIENSQDFGGISGTVLKEQSFKIFKALAKELYGKTTLISVGGIDSADEAYKRILHGASLIQIYSNLIFDGPELIKSINLGLIEKLKADGFKNISEAIGAKL